MRARLVSFDILKLFSIYLVIWGHAIQYLLSSDYVDEPVYRYIYSFHMPLFMMISGYFASSAMNLSPMELIKKKFIQLLLPCITWGIFVWVAISIWRFIKNGDLSFDGLLSILVFNYWFLKSLFVCYLLAYFGKRLCKNTFCWVIVTFICVCIYDIYYLQIMYPCFLCGMFLRMKDSWWQKNVISLSVLFGIVFIILLCFWDKSFWDYANINLKSLFVGKGHYSLVFAYRELYRIFIGIVGACFFVFLFYLLFNRSEQARYLDICSDWGRYTLDIYILQSIVLEVIMAKFLVLIYEFTLENFRRAGIGKLPNQSFLFN